MDAVSSLDESLRDLTCKPDDRFVTASQPASLALCIAAYYVFVSTITIQSHHTTVTRGRGDSRFGSILRTQDGEGVEVSLASQTLSVPQHRSLSVSARILKAIGAVERKGSGLRD